MNRFIGKTVKYLVTTFVLSALIIYIFITIKPAYFLGAPVDYYYCTYQYEQINKKTGYRNIIIGDSRGNASINPKVLGNEWINLSIPGSDLFEGYLTLKKYLLNNKVDTLVMVYGLYYLAEVSPYFNRRTIPFQFLNYDELKDLEQVEKKCKYKFHDASITGPRALSLAQYDRRLKYWHFPFHYRETFIDGLNSLWNTRADVNVAKQKVIKQLTEYRGYMNFGEADSNNTDGVNDEFDFDLPPVSKHYFDQLMEVVAKNKITVYLIMAPINHTSFMTYNKSPFQTSVDKYMKGLQSQYPHLHIIQGPVCLPNTLFGDAYHVNKKGTAFFSAITRKSLDSARLER